MPPVSKMPFGLDFAFKRGARSPLIPITLDEEEEKETLKPPEFKALTQEDIKKIKAESVKANTEEFNRVWKKIYEPAWNEWKKMEEEAGRPIEEDRSLHNEPPRIKRYEYFRAFLANHIPRYQLPDFDLAKAKKRKPKYEKGGGALVPKLPNIVGPAILVDRHGKEYTSVWPCDRRLLLIGLPGYTPKPMGEDDIVLSAANNLHTAWRVAPSKKDDTDAKDYPYEEHAWHEDSDQFFWNDKLGKVGNFSGRVRQFPVSFFEQNRRL